MNINLIAMFALFICTNPAFSHVTLQDPVTSAGAAYRAVLRVGHGCEGSSTTGMKVTMPAGFNGAQPMPKPGWTVSTTVGKLAEPYESHGTRYTEGVLEIIWTAKGSDNALPAAHYDEFVFRGTASAKVGPQWFKVLQSCDKGVNAWVDVPASGINTKDLKMPAALLQVQDVQGAGHSH
jgi:uncharacterized protein YcnI